VKLLTTPLLSPAWMDLIDSQKALYLYCKMRKYGEKSKHEEQLFNDFGIESPKADVTIDTYFSLNKALIINHYKVYSDSNLSRTFYPDIAALIEHGFIMCVHCGKSMRVKSLYRFSDGWQHWTKKDGLVIPLDDMTDGMKTFDKATGKYIKKERKIRIKKRRKRTGKGK
jgi:hypothetical protein